MFDELLFILNFVINVFYDCHMMITKAMRRSQKGWSVCSTLGWSLQGQSYMISCKIAWGSLGGVLAQMEVLGIDKDGAQSIDDVLLCFVVDIIFCICYTFLFNIVYFLHIVYDTSISISINWRSDYDSENHDFPS